MEEVDSRQSRVEDKRQTAEEMKRRNTENADSGRGLVEWIAEEKQIPPHFLPAPGRLGMTEAQKSRPNQGFQISRMATASGRRKPFCLRARAIWPR